MNCDPKHVFLVLAVAFPVWASIAQASAPVEFAKLDADSAKACIAASAFNKAKVSAPTRFSDTVGFDVRIVSGTYPQKHMKGMTGKMLCLYNRKTKSVEVQELP